MLLFSSAVFAEAYGISLSADKSLYGSGEAIMTSGYVYLAANNTTSPVSSGNVSIGIENASFSPVSADSTVSVSGGYFNSTLSAPSPAGSYFVRAKYTDSNGTLWQSSILFRVTAVSIDSISLRPNKAGYYPGEAVSMVIEPVVEVPTGYTRLAGVEVYGNVRYMNGSVIQPFGNCAETGSNRTGPDGRCTISFSQSLPPGTYLLEANDFAGSNTFSVIPFDAAVSIKDGTGEYVQSVFSGDQAGRVAVSVLYNGSMPANGSYYFAGNISYGNGTVALAIPRTNVSNSTYSGFYQFTTGNFSTGTYTVQVVVAADGGSAVSSTTFFEVRTWSLSIDRLSGFASAYNAFPGTAVSFSVSAADLSTGSRLLLDANNTNVSLFSRLGRKLANYVPAWNSTLNASVVSFVSPASVGTYVLSVSASSGGITQSAERVFRVVDVTASALSADGERQPKDLFGGSEYVYLLVSAENSAGAVQVFEAEIAEITDDAGNRLNYTNASWAVDSNATSEWRVNVSGGRAFFKVDNPRRGGSYSARIYLNERAAVATAKFVIDPYNVFATPKGENDESGWGGRWQFSTRDKVLFTVRVYNANRKSGTSRMAFEEAYGGGMMMSGSSGGSSANAVSNATVEVEQVSNDMLMQPIPLSKLNVSCTATDGTGRSDCSAIPSGGKWDGGWYHVVFRVTGPDGVTSGIGHSGFEARSFYISGYAYDPNRNSSGMGWGDGKWVHLPSDNVSVRAYMFDAGNMGWWGYYAGGNSVMSSAGLSGTIAVEKILYRGSPGTWIWPPVTVSSSEYTTSGTGAVSGGQGNLTIIPASRWKTGSYSAILRGTKVSGNDSETDYGEVWFEVRRWDAWSSPVNLNSSAGGYWRSSFNLRENVTLYVSIRNAGEYCWSWPCPQTDLAGGAPVSIGVKKIEDFSSWPPKEMDPAEYSVTPISVSRSSPDMWSGQLNRSYVLSIVPSSGSWAAGYYNVVLDVNGTETGYGWFNAIAFYANAQLVDGNGNSKWTVKGDSDLYFNVTTTMSPYYGWGSAPFDMINTTVKEVRLRSFSEGSWVQREYSFVSGSGSNDFNVTPLAVNGRGTVAFHRNGSWDFGSYNGEMILQDSTGATATAWIYFQVKPFEISTSTSSWEVSARSAVNVSLRIIQDWSNYSTLLGNYTVESVKETGWGLERTIYNYAPGNGTTFDGLTDLVIPPNVSWATGYHSLVITVSDNGSRRGTAWVSFNAVPFSVDVSSERWAYRSSENVTFNLTVRATSSYGSPLSYANVSRVVETDWSSWPPRETVLNFSVSSPNATGKIVNGTGVLKLVPPSGGWLQAYHNVELQFADSDVGGPAVKRYVSFDVRPYNMWAYPVNVTSGWWVSGFARDENVTLRLNVYEIGSPYYSEPALVNITRVEYRRSYDWMAQYSNGTYSINGSAGMEVNGTALVVITPPPGGWSEGSYEMRVTVSGPQGAAMANVWFQALDRTAPGVSILSPSPGQVVNDSAWPVLLLAGTTKLASCEYQTGFMSWRSWMSYRQFNHSAYVPSSHLPSNGNSTVTVYCRDDSGNENSTSVTFYVNVSGRGVPPRANITSPQGGATNVSLVPNITVSFSKPMSWVSASLRYSGGYYGYLSYPGVYNATSAVFSVSPYYPLSENTTYTFNISSGQDLDGNYLEGLPVYASFTTWASAANATNSTGSPNQVFVSYPQNGASVSSSLVVLYNITGNFSRVVNVSYGLDGGAYAGLPLAGPVANFSLSGLSLGAHGLVVSIFNSSGLASSASANFTVTGAQELLSNGGFGLGQLNWTLFTNFSDPVNMTRLDNATYLTPNASVRSYLDYGLILRQNVSDVNVPWRLYNFSVHLARDSSFGGPDGYALRFYLGYVDNASILRNVSVFPPAYPNVTANGSFIRFATNVSMAADAANLTSFWVEKSGPGLFWIDDLSLWRES